MTMITFFKKYWLGILLFLLWGVIVFFFDPRQRQFYLNGDIKEFEAKSNLALIIIETAVFVIWLAIVMRNNLKEMSISAIYLIVNLFFIYLFFHSAFTATGLYINRQIAGKEFDRKYSVQFLNDDKTVRGNFYLYDVDTRQILTDPKWERSVFTPGLNPNDIIQIRFIKGLLGVAYPKNGKMD